MFCGILNFILKNKQKYVVNSEKNELTFCENDLIKLLDEIPGPNPNSLIWFEGDWIKVKEARKKICQRLNDKTQGEGK